MINFLKRVLGLAEKTGEQPVLQAPHNNGPNKAEAKPVTATPFKVVESDEPGTAVSGNDEAKLYLEKVQAKINKLAEDFANGSINRDQFQNLYAHYQREMSTVAGMLAMSDEDWRDAVTDGQSFVIRQQHRPKAQGYAIYENESGMPLSTLGKFDMDPALLVPMLSSYRAATKEIFGAGMKSTAIEGGRWLCFVPGELTTMMAIFRAEPARKQLSFLDELHRLFEKANKPILANPPVDPEALIFPHEHFLGKWRR